MFKNALLSSTALVLVMAALVLSSTRLAMAADAGLNANARAALKNLYQTSPAAKMVSEKAVAVLVFPKIVKAGLMVGGQYGKGVLFRNGKVVAHYNSVSASYGLQAGVQKFGYALFFLTESAVNYLDKSGGWEIGVGPSIVVVDTGTARTMTSTTLKADIYAFIFSQKGLMAGIGLQGTKITKIK